MLTLWFIKATYWSCEKGRAETLPFNLSLPYRHHISFLTPDAILGIVYHENVFKINTSNHLCFFILCLTVFDVSIMPLLFWACIKGSFLWLFFHMRHKNTLDQQFSVYRYDVDPHPSLHNNHRYILC